MAKRKLTARQIRWLFATGKLRASGKGKDRKVTYSKEGQAPKRAAIGGSKAAGLRSGSGKRDFSATRAQRIAAGREKAQGYLSSEKGQRLRSGVEALRNANRRTGRRDFDKEKKVKAAKDDVRAAGVKIKTATALSKKYDTPRLRGQYSDRAFTRDTPKYAAQKAATQRKADRAAAREATIAPVRGKSRAERIAAGRAVAEASPATRVFRYMQQAKAEQAAQAKRAARLTGRNNRVRRGEAIRAAQRAEQRQAEAQAFQRRSAARDKRSAGAAQVQAKKARAARIASGRAVLAAFRQRRDSQYSTKLF